MTLSVVIVNYNVKYFLEQCLESVFASQRIMPDGGNLDIEVWVVDNASVDGSVEMVRDRFPQVHLIANTQNVGFARANNQALQQPTADYVLLLNPDTVVERDTLVHCVDFFTTHPDCGGLGVKMINGEGKYLKESKRGFPSPAASFFKISGLIHLFPHNRRIAAYYMGHLPDDEPNPVDILPGAFLMVRQEALAKVGLLDESYFMYGEDIDFSWRIRLAGYENWYLPTARIIHYKGESTRRGSMNYVYTFYNAMSIFVQHYFTGRGARLFNHLLHLAIWARATLSFLQRALKALLLPLADFAIAFAGFLTIEHFWSAQKLLTLNSQLLTSNYYPPEYTFLVIPLYILVLMACSWLYGGYAKPLRLSRIVKGMAVGSALLLLFYSLLDETLRYSRALLLLGCAWTLLSTLALRGLLSLLHLPGYDLRPRRPRHCLIVGSEAEYTRIRDLYTQWGYTHRFSTLADTSRLSDAIHVHRADEVVFSGRDIPVGDIIDLMTSLSENGMRRQVEFKIAPESTEFVIGANRIHSAEDLYTEELNTLAIPLNRRNKRLFDILSSLLLLLLSPLLIWWQKSRAGFFRHTLQVLSGKKSWVGDAQKSIFTPEQSLRRPATPIITDEVRDRLRLRYYRNYRISTDLSILLRNLPNISTPQPTLHPSTSSHLHTFTLLLFLLLLSPKTHAQYINAYATAGATVSQIEGDELKGFKHWGFTGGVGALVRFGQDGTWSLAIETDYSGRGVYNNLHTSDNLYNIDLTLHYIDIPLTLFFRDPVGGIRVGIGPVYSRLVQQPHGEIHCRPSFFCPDTDDMLFLKNDLALAAELRFPVWKGLQFSVRYQYSLFPVKKGWTFTEGHDTWQNDCYNQSVSFRLLWLFGEPERPPRHQPTSRRHTNSPHPNVRVRRNKR